MSNFFKNILNDMDGKGDSSLLGPQYSYYKQINTPKEMGMSSDGTTEAIENDVNGLINYVRLLIEGGGPASKVPGPLGNKYFLKTAASCTDKASGELVDRSLYFNNVPDGSIPFLSEALGEDFTTWEGLLPGVLEDIEKINPLGIFQAFVEGKNPDCRAITMQVRDISNNNSNQTAYVTDNDIRDMDPCWFSDHKNPVTGESRTNCNSRDGAGGDERCSDPSNCIILTGTNSYSPGSVELDGNIALTTPGFKQKQIGCFTLDGADAIENTTWQQKLKDGPKCRVSSINVPDNMDVVALAGTGGAWTNNFCEIADPISVAGSIYLRSGPNDLPSNTCGFKFTPKCSDISCIKITASDGTYIWLDATTALTKYGTGQTQAGCWSLDNNHIWENVLKKQSVTADIGAGVATSIMGGIAAGSLATEGKKTVCDICAISLPNAIGAIAVTSHGNWDNLCKQTLITEIPSGPDTSNARVLYEQNLLDPGSKWYKVPQGNMHHAPTCGFLFFRKPSLEQFIKITNRRGVSVYLDKTNVATNSGNGQGPGCYSLDQNTNWQLILKEKSNNCDVASITLPSNISATAWRSTSGWKNLCSTGNWVGGNRWQVGVEIPAGSTNWQFNKEPGHGKRMESMWISL